MFLPPEYIEAFERHQRAAEAANIVAQQISKTGVGDERLWALNEATREEFEKLESVRRKLGLTQ
jgi:hypothetical protein